MNHLFCMSCSSDQKVVTDRKLAPPEFPGSPESSHVVDLWVKSVGKSVGKCGENHVAKIDFHITSFF